MEKKKTRHKKRITYTVYISNADESTVQSNINDINALILLAKSYPWHTIEVVRHTDISEPARIKNRVISHKTSSIVLVCPENLTPDNTSMSANLLGYQKTNVASDLTKGGKIPQNICAFFGVNNKER